MAASVEPQSAESAQKYVDFDEYVEFQVAKTQQRIKTTEIATTCFSVGTFFLAALLAFVVLDQWAIPGGFSVGARALILAGLLGVSGGWLIWRAILPYLRSVNALFAARMIEAADPQLKSSLLNLVDLQHAGKEISTSVQRAMEKRAAIELAHVDIDQAIDRRHLLRMAYALLAVIVVCCGYALFSPKDAFSSVKRLLLPTAHTAVATQTSIANVSPEDTRILARTLLTVEADVLGKIPEQVTLFYTTADRKFVDQPVEMRSIQQGQARYRGIITGEDGRGLLQNLSYYIAAGDARTRDYQVEVAQPPSAKIESIRLTFPPYMQLEPKTLSEGHIDTWEGTKVALQAVANMPVQSAILVFTDTEDPHERGEEVRMHITDGTKLAAEWKLAFRADGTQPHYYHIRCTTASGEIDPEPTRYTINIRPDQRPEVTLVHPVQDLERPANAIVPLLIRASDPDFMLRFLTLRVEKAGEEVFSAHIFEGEQPSWEGSFDFNLQEVGSNGLKPGDEIQFWIEARDNKQPLGNRTNTQPLKITIIKRVSPDEVQEQLAADKQAQQDQLAQSEQPQNDQNRNQANPQEEGSGERPQDANAENRAQPMPGEEPQDKQDKQDQGQSEKKNPQGGDEQQGEGQKAGKKGNGQSPKQDGQQGEPGEKGKGQNGEKSSQPNADQPADEQEALQKLIQRQQKKQKEKEAEAGEKQEQSSQSQQPSKSKPGSQGEKSEQQSPGDQSENSEKKQPNQKQSDQGKPGSQDQSSGEQPKPQEGEKAPQPQQKQPGDKAGNQSEKPPKAGDSDSGEQKPKAGSNEKQPGDKNSQNPNDAGEQPQDSNKQDSSKQDSNKQDSGKQDSGKQNPGKQPGESSDGQGNDEKKPSPMDDAQKEGAQGDKPDKSAKNKPGEKGGADKPQGDGQEPGAKNPDTEGGNTPSPDKPNPDDQPKTDGEGGDQPAPEKSPMQDKQGKQGKKSNPPREGEQKPAEDSPDAVDREATGNEKGQGTPEENPTGDEKQAKNKLERKPGTKPAPQPKKTKEPGDPMNTDNAAGKDPQQAERAPKQADDGQERPKQDDAATGEEKGADAKNPPGKRPSKETPKEEQPKGPGRKGQQSQKPDTGEAGGSAQQEEGNKGGTEEGAGDKQDQPGKANPAGKQNGKPSDGDEQGPGSKSKPSDAGGKPGKPSAGKQDGQKGKGDESNSQPGGPGESGEKGKSSDKGQPGGKANQPGKAATNGDRGQQMEGGGAGDGNAASEQQSRKPENARGAAGDEQGPGKKGDAGDGESQTPPEPDAEPADLENARKASNLVLKQLKQDLEQGEVDQKLLDELGWTKDDMKRFAEKLERQLQQDRGNDETPEAAARRRQFEAMLESLNLNQNTTVRKGNKTRTNRTNEINMQNRPAPAEFREYYDAYTKGLSQRNQPPAKQK